jgi:hypothetical protein
MVWPQQEMPRVMGCTMPALKARFLMTRGPDVLGTKVHSWDVRFSVVTQRKFQANWGELIILLHGSYVF